MAKRTKRKTKKMVTRHAQRMASVSSSASSVLPVSIPVVVIGAGPVGLCAANLLGSYGVPCLVLERRRTASVLPRAILVDDESLRTLQAVGLDEAFRARITEGRGARYYDARGEPFAEVGAGPQNYGFPKRSHFFQPDLEALLLSALQRRYEGLGSAAAFGHELVGMSQDADGVTLHVIDRRNAAAAAAPAASSEVKQVKVRTEFVLGCDGARSFVREALGVEMEGADYPEEWVILDMHNDPDQEPISKFHCRTDRPYVSVVGPPSRGGLGRRYEFRARPGVDTAEAMREPENAAAALLAGIRPVAPGDVSRAAVYSFEAKLAAHFQQGRVFLLGDAAHLTPPFAGQGMNAGIRDAHNLAWKVAACVASRQASQAGLALLGTYDDERRTPAWSMVQLAVAMGEIVMPEGAAEVDFRRRTIEYMERFPAARDYVVGMKFKPPPSYDKGAFVGLGGAAQRDAFAGSIVGHMLPQPPVRWNRAHRSGATGAMGTQPRLDDVMGAGFALLAQGASTASEMYKARGELWPELSPTLLLLSDDEPHCSTDGFAALRPDWASEHAALPMSVLRAHRDQVLLVRPDRFVAAAFWPSNAASVHDTVAAFRSAMGRSASSARL